MITTPELPLKLRRKGCPDFHILDSPIQQQDQEESESDIDMPYSSPLSTSYSSFSDFDNYVPRSPTFCSSSSSAAPSSPVRALFTPEPPSSPFAEPHIASSPKSFWDVALNYGPEHPYKIKGRPAEQLYSSQHRNRMGTRVLSKPATKHLPPVDASEDTDEGEIDVASVLLDLKRRVRVSPTLPEPPKRSEPESVSPMQETPATDDANGSSRPEGGAETKMQVDGAPEKAEERAVCSAIDTNQPALDVPSTSFDPCASQTSEPAVEATISAENVPSIPSLISPAHAPNYEESATACIPAVEDAEPIADVEPADGVVTLSCPSLELLDAPPDSDLIVRDSVGHVNHDAPALSELTELSSQVLSSLSSPVLPSSSRPSSPLSEPLYPISHDAERCEDDGRVLEPFPGKEGSCEQANSMPSPPSCDTPVAGPSKIHAIVAETTEAKNVSSKRKHEDDSALDEEHGYAESRAAAPVKEKKKRQEKTKNDEALPSGDVRLPTSVPKPRKRQPKKHKEMKHETSKLESSNGTASDHDRENISQSSSNTVAPSKQSTAECPSNTIKRPVPEEIPADPSERAELSGLLVQTMALSRASSMPASSLHRELLRENPHFASRREKHLWLALIEGVLASHPFFGRIERKGLDADDKPLEAQWFYMPEADVDQERATLLKEMMPKKRSATKTHKQYFFKPLGKISRWDPEDAL